MKIERLSTDQHDNRKMSRTKVNNELIQIAKDVINERIFGIKLKKALKRFYFYKTYKRTQIDNEN